MSEDNDWLLIKQINELSKNEKTIELKKYFLLIHAKFDLICS